MQYQVDLAKSGSEILLRHKIVMFVMEMRTGKTNTAFNCIEFCQYQKALFITTKKAIPSIISDYKGRTKFQLTVINYESLHKLEGRYDVVVIDECHKLGTYPKPSQRTRSVKDICKGLPIIYLSGTPTPESYSQIFYQLWVSSFTPFRELNFYVWAKTYVDVRKIMIKSMLVNDYSRARIDLIKEKIKSLQVSYTQKEAGFKHVTQDILLSIDMPHLLTYLQSELENNEIVYYYNKVSTINQASDIVMKLSQIAGGTLIFDADEKGTILDKTKAEYIKENFASQKIAIYYKFKAEFELLSSEFPNWTDCPKEFKDSNKVFLGQLVSGREGIDLSTADCMIMYNVDYSATTYFQVRERMQKYNRDKEVNVYYLTFRGSVEEKILRAVMKKKNFTYSHYLKTKGNAVHR